MDRLQNLRADDGLLLLGRLDGRLHSSACADIYLARARLSGAAALAGLAGVPISVRDLQAWIAGRSPPPRASEGLNDPYSVAAIFHLALSRDEGLRFRYDERRALRIEPDALKSSRPKGWPAWRLNFRAARHQLGGSA